MFAGYKILKNIFLISLVLDILACLSYLLLGWNEHLPEANYDPYKGCDWLVVKMFKRNPKLDTSIVGEIWMKKCKKHGPLTWCEFFLVNFIWRRLFTLYTTTPRHLWFGVLCFTRFMLNRVSSFNVRHFTLYTTRLSSFIVSYFTFYTIRLSSFIARHFILYTPRFSSLIVCYFTLYSTRLSSFTVSYFTFYNICLSSFIARHFILYTPRFSSLIVSYFTLYLLLYFTLYSSFIVWYFILYTNRLSSFIVWHFSLYIICPSWFIFGV